MLSLRELQQNFVGTVDGTLSAAELDRLIGHIGDDPARARDRLDVYANTILVNRRNALRATYPVVERLVGGDFFDYAAGIFARSYPSLSGNMDEYGREFADFLAGFEPVAPLAYLPDVARLELLIDQALVAEDSHPARRIAAPLAAYGLRLNRVLQLAPGSRLLRSDFPVHRIWQVNQPDCASDGVVDLAEGGACLLVRRNRFDVEIASLDPAEFAFLSAVASGLSLGAAIVSACAVQPCFDPAAVLYRRIGDGTVALPVPPSIANDEDYDDAR
jgi:hypothetical protein